MTQRPNSLNDWSLSFSLLPLHSWNPRFQVLLKIFHFLYCTTLFLTSQLLKTLVPNPGPFLRLQLKCFFLWKPVGCPPSDDLRGWWCLPCAPWRPTLPLSRTFPPRFPVMVSSADCQFHHGMGAPCLCLPLSPGCLAQNRCLKSICCMKS